MRKTTVQRIAARNDELRRRIYFPPEGDVVILDPSIKKAPDPFLQAVRDFDDFTPEDDPQGTHEHGRFVVNSIGFQFTIEYWNADLSQSGANPLEETTRRIISIGPSS